MANQKLTDKTSLTELADGDQLHVVDVSDISSSVEGTSKKSAWSLFKSTLKTYFDTFYVASSAVINQALTGYTKGAGTVAATDTILEAIQKIDGNVAALESSVILKGEWDASAGTFPGVGSAQAGWSYIVSVAGTVDSVAFNVGDRVIAIVDNASTSTYASNWFKADYTDQVLSVHSRTGAVVSANGDYTASQVTNVAAGNIAAITVQAAIDELDAEKQPLDAELTAIAGLTSAADKVPYFTGSGTASVLQFVEDETPSGTIDSVNTTFTLANTPLSGSVVLFLNGLKQKAGAGNDYTISGGTITMLTAPDSGDSLEANYRY